MLEKLNATTSFMLNSKTKLNKHILRNLALAFRSVWFEFEQILHIFEKHVVHYRKFL